MFKNVISLGFFCSTASEIEKIGLRSSSNPFDWIISDFRGVIECIENDFNGFLDYTNLLQYENKCEYYYDEKYKFHFFHDFSKYRNLNSQLDDVKDKYNRRINRFKEDICKPTLFLRYIRDKEELEYIENNYDYIIGVLSKHNCKNKLILISNNDIRSNTLKIYTVEKDDNDTVARKFLEKNIELEKYLLSNIYDEKCRKNNIETYLKSEQNKKIIKHFEKIKNIYNKMLKKEYVHDKKINF